MAPVFEITYTSGNQRHATKHFTEWVCPAGYDIDTARESFEGHFSSTAVVSITRLTADSCGDDTLSQSSHCKAVGTD